MEIQADGSLKAWLTSPPVDGAANAALVVLLADIAGVAKSKVDIVSGHTSRQKVVLISGIETDQFVGKLAQPPLL